MLCRCGQQRSMKEKHHDQQAECLGILLVRVLANDRPGPEQHPPEHHPRSGHHQQQTDGHVVPQLDGLIRQQLRKHDQEQCSTCQKRQNRRTTWLAFLSCGKGSRRAACMTRRKPQLLGMNQRRPQRIQHGQRKPQGQQRQEQVPPSGRRRHLPEPCHQKKHAQYPWNKLLPVIRLRLQKIMPGTTLPCGAKPRVHNAERKQQQQNDGHVPLPPNRARTPLEKNPARATGPFGPTDGPMSTPGSAPEHVMAPPSTVSPMPPRLPPSTVQTVAPS